MALRYIYPGKPDQHALVERFNRTFRHEVPDAYVFESLDQVREISAEWMRESNEERPHETLDRMPLSVFRAHQTVGNSPNRRVSLTGEFTVGHSHGERCYRGKKKARNDGGQA